MDVSEESIRERINYLFDKYNFKIYKESKEQWINRKTDYCILILTTKMKFLDIIKEIRKKYNYIFPLEQSEKDMMQNSLKRSAEYYNIPLEDIKERYTDNYDEVEERMMFRIELYKEGWSVEQIERYIYKYLLKEDYPELDLERYRYLYHNIMAKHNFLKEEKEKKLGRPSLPCSLKEYIKNKHKEKTRDNMRLKYIFSNEYEKIKEHLLTEEEIEEIYKNIKNNTILTKIKNLKI